LLGFDNPWHDKIAINKISIQLLIILDWFQLLIQFLEIADLIVFIFIIEYPIIDEIYYFLQIFRLSIWWQISFTPKIFHFI
jgi:hypothetical protein